MMSSSGTTETGREGWFTRSALCPSGRTSDGALAARYILPQAQLASAPARGERNLVTTVSHVSVLLKVCVYFLP
jgi:hypothetical protein